MAAQDWAALRARLAGRLSDEDTQIVDLLVEGKSTVEIGHVLGQHRSMVWRKMQRIKKRAQV